MMLDRLKNRLRFQLESFLLRGSRYRLLFIAVTIAAISLAAGLLAFWAEGGFGTRGEAVWWAFLRLTDPGYLGDDEGYALRIISTVVTVLGYVFFMGALIAIMTQGLNETIERLQRGLTPIARKHHVVLLGWTNRTPIIIEEILRSEERVRHFLRRLGASRLHIAVLVERARPELLQELKDRLGPLFDAGQITFRSGSSLRAEHLSRVDYRRAAVIILPAGEYQEEGSAPPDGRAVKVILSAADPGAGADVDSRPLMVAEIFDHRKAPLARRAYAGPIEIVTSDLFTSRLIAQTVRHRGLSHVYSELLTQDEGNEIYIRACPELAGRSVAELAPAFPRAIPIGLLREEQGALRPMLNPAPELKMASTDRLVLVAPTYAESGPGDSAPGPAPRAAGTHFVSPPSPADRRRLLLLGWNRKVPALINEFDSTTGEAFEMDVLSLVTPEERRTATERCGVRPARITVRHLEGDYTSIADLEKIDVGEYTNVVLLASDRLESGEASDARTVLGHILIQEVVSSGGPKPGILVELMDTANAQLFRDQDTEVLVSTLVIGHITSQVALRRELAQVFDELFGPAGAEITFRDAAGVGLAGNKVRFPDVQAAAAARGEIALGFRCFGPVKRKRGGVMLNPDRDTAWRLDDGDQVVVLSGRRKGA